MFLVTAAAFLFYFLSPEICEREHGAIWSPRIIIPSSPVSIAAGRWCQNTDFYKETATFFGDFLKNFGGKNNRVYCASGPRLPTLQLCHKESFVCRGGSVYVDVSRLCTSIEDEGKGCVEKEI